VCGIPVDEDVALWMSDQRGRTRGKGPKKKRILIADGGNGQSRDCATASSTPNLRPTAHLGPTLLLLMVTAAIAILSMHVRSEEEGPPIAVISPENGQLLNVSSTLVVGITAPDATVNVSVEKDFGVRVWYETTADERGRFELAVRLPEGSVQIQVKATDGSGSSTTIYLGVLVDTIPPRMHIMSPKASPAYTSSHSYDIAVIVEDEGAGPCTMAVDIDLGEVTGVAKRTVDLTEGENVFNVLARDRAGNVAAQTVTIIADFTPPVLAASEPPYQAVFTNGSVLRFAGNVSGASTVVLEWADNETDATLAGGDWAAGGLWGYEMVLGPDDGPFVVFVHALDDVGNWAMLKFTVTVDRAPPSLDIWPRLPWRAIAPWVTIKGETESGIDIVLVNGIWFPTVDGRFDIRWPLVEGWNDVVIEVQDAAGNVARDEYEVMYSDGTPSLTLHHPGESDGPEVRIRGETDANVELAYVDGVQVVVVNGSFEAVVRLDRGVNRIRVHVEDPAGNLGSAEAEVRYGLSVAEVTAVALVVVAAALGVGLLLRRRGWRRGLGRGRPPLAHG